MSLSVTFYLAGSYSGTYSSAPTSLSYTSTKNESSEAGAVNHIVNGSASGSGSTTNTSQSASVNTGTDTPASDDYTNYPGSSIPGNPWMGSNMTWTFNYYIYSNSMASSGQLVHPTSGQKDDYGEGDSWVNYILTGVS